MAQFGENSFKTSKWQGTMPRSPLMRELLSSSFSAFGIFQKQDASFLDGRNQRITVTQLAMRELETTPFKKDAAAITIDISPRGTSVRTKLALV